MREESIILKGALKNILVINLGGIGDLLLSTPALRSLKAKYPSAEIAILVVPRVSELARGFSYIDKVYVFGISLKLSSIINNLRTLAVLRREEFDLAINMRTLVSNLSALKINILLKIISPKIKAGRDTEGRGRFLEIKIPETGEGEKYEMEYDIDTARALGAQEFDRNLEFQISREDESRVFGLLEKNGIKENDIVIGINPGGVPSRRWPIRNFSEAINSISEKAQCKFILTGSANEINLARGIAELTNRDIDILNVAGELSIGELGALIKRCDCFISNDTGPMHIAAILKVPLVAIFGPGPLIRFDPRNISGETAVLYKKAGCAPCNRFSCGSLDCLKAISPDEVVQAALDALRKHNPKTYV